jgi:hypothetical protein
MEPLREILEKNPQRLVIDLDQVTFLDSTGLGVRACTAGAGAPARS